MNWDFHQVDVFTQSPFGGNPLAVFPRATGLDAQTMQNIAREMNCSESAFVLPPSDGRAIARVRIFTPMQELPFAGHPTIGTAFVLDTLGRIPSDAFAFEMGVGLVGLRRESKTYWMTPPTATASQPVARAADVAAALHLKLGECTHDPVVAGAGALAFLCIQLTSIDAVDAIAIDRAALALVAGTSVGEGDLLIFAREEASVYSRMFAHVANGIGEDPATGSSIAPMCAALQAYGQLTDLSFPFVVRQGVKMGRPSELFVRRAASESSTAIEVGGNAVPMLHGTLTLQAPRARPRAHDNHAPRRTRR